MSRRRDEQSPLELELRRERASSMARAGERFESALETLAGAEAALLERGSAEREAARDEALAHAGERLWFLVVQREGMGLRHHGVLDDVWRIPPKVRAAMGPRPAGRRLPGRRRPGPTSD